MVSRSFSRSSVQINFGQSRRSSKRSSFNYREPVHVQPLSPVLKKPSPLWERLHPHQKAGVNFALRLNGSFLAFEQRTGKTWCTGEYLWQLDKPSVLIVGFKSNLISTWGAFLAKWLPNYVVFTEWQSYSDHQKGFVKAWGIRDHAIFLIHYEGLPKLIKKLVSHKFDVAVYDEVQRLKGRSSAASRYARRLRTVPHRLALSGTPMDDSPNQMWAILRFVEPEALGVQWSDYESFFTRPTGYMGKVRKFREERKKYFIDRIRPFVFRITKEDAGVLRTKVRWKSVKMEAEQEKLYRKLERDMVVDVDNTIITTPLTVTQIGKLQQITGGQIIDEDGNIHRVGRAKQKALHNILMEEDELPIVIFCKYTHEVEECVRIAKRFYDRVSMLNGSVKDKTYKRKPDQLNRTWMLQAFQRGEIDVLVCQQRTGGVGVDMYLSNFAIVYSCSHSFIDFDQMTSRLDVFEKKVPSEMLVLYIRSTIDEDIRTAIKDKVSVTTATLNRLRRKDYQNAKDRKRG